jgi:radical SAM protein with 4Fe4S-binding SPASM domain
MNLSEVQKVIHAQNRIKYFPSDFGHSFLYDALSQNIYPITKDFEAFFFSDTFSIKSESEEKRIFDFCNKLTQWKDIHNLSRLPETHLTINFSNKCNLNCSYCYRHKESKNTMTLEKAFDVIEYVEKYYKKNNDEIIFSIDMTAEALLDADEIIKFDEKLAEHEYLYIEENEMLKGSSDEFLQILKGDLYPKKDFDFTGDAKSCFKKILLDEKLYKRFSETSKVNLILEKGNYSPLFLDKKRLLRLNRELLENFYPDFLKHKDFQQYRIWFMSNGVHITQQEIELIRRIHIDPFWISLDGPEDVHNKHRKYYDNKGSFNDVIQNIKLFQENDIHVKISCVLTSDYPYPELLYEYFKSLNISSIQMTPIRNGTPSSFTEENLVKLNDGYRKLYDRIFYEVQEGDFSSFRLLCDDLSMIALSNLLCRTRMSSRCTWGNEVVLDEKGNMYPCLYVIGNEEYILANIAEKKSSKELLKPILVNQREKCSICWARYLCGGTCHYNSIVNNKTEQEVDDIECQIRMSVITESINFLIRMIENKIDMDKVLKCFR